MKAINELTGKLEPLSGLTRVITSYSGGITLFGYIPKGSRTILLDGIEASYDLLKDMIVYSKYDGGYHFRPKKGSDFKDYVLGYGGFPYTFSRKYEAVENFHLFKNQQVIHDNTKYHLADFLKYTIGLEFETAAGYIPEHKCFEDGLIPLRDGSIRGLEYSTVVLKGNEGLNLLHQQLDTLRDYTITDKECSLHIHMGGYPLDPMKIMNLYVLCKRIEGNLGNLLPSGSFNTSEYKNTEKNYCNKLPMYNSFEDLYRGLVGTPYLGDLFQAHPDDVDRHHKWNIHSRYMWLNLINILCYKVNKTVEFRFLRPTYNFNKIILWLYIFNGLLICAEKANSPYGIPKVTEISEVMSLVYPREVFDYIVEGLARIRAEKMTQNNFGDTYGLRTDIDSAFFPPSFIF